MNRRIVATFFGAGLLAAASQAAAQEHVRHGGMGHGSMTGRFSQEDRDAFVDARVAALRAGLRLSPDQEKLWPALEEAIRSFVQQRREHMRSGHGGDDRSGDIPAMIRDMAERQAARAESLRKLADAAAPLYATLDEGQKRRLTVLTRGLRPRGMMRGSEYWHGERDRLWRERDRL